MAVIVLGLNFGLVCTLAVAVEETAAEAPVALTVAEAAPEAAAALPEAAAPEPAAALVIP